jgi:hypothetical protein
MMTTLAFLRGETTATPCSRPVRLLSSSVAGRSFACALLDHPRAPLATSGDAKWAQPRVHLDWAQLGEVRKCVGSASHSPSAEQFNTSATSPKRENHYLFPTLSEDHRRSLARPLERQRAVVVKHLHVLDGLLCFPIGAASDLAANC